MSQPLKPNTMARKHTRDEVLRSLAKKNDVASIDNDSKVVSIYGDYSKHRKNDLGNGSWGKIDFLTRWCGYVVRYV